MAQIHFQRRIRAAALPLLLALGAALLAGCSGTLEIWMLGNPIGDDDDNGLQLDYSTFEGTEFVNIDWDQEAWPQGIEDCQADWHALGADSTADNQDLCPSCDLIWSTQLTSLAGADNCLQGTALPAPADLTVRMGFEFLEALPHFFTVWRSVGDSPMVAVGVGAIDEARAKFTWSGQESYRNDGEIIGYEWFRSGEGSF
jgi:hypothetical protein